MRAALDRAERELARFLRGREGPLPALRDVRADYDDYFYEILFTASFFDGTHFRWTAHPRDLECNLATIQSHTFERECYSLYSRLYDDEAMRREIRPMVLQLRAMQEAGAPGFSCMELRRAIDERERHFRRHRARGEPVYYGVDLAAPGTELTTVSMRRYGGVTFDTLAFDEAYVITAEQQRAIAERIRRNVEDAYRVPERYLRDDSYAKAEAKGLALLKAWLSPEQLASYERTRHFEVVGSKTGKRYRISHGRQQNIHELDAGGEVVCGWCFLPEGQLVAGDVMLAQKIALETDEKAALKVANRFGDRREITFGGGRREGHTAAMAGWNMAPIQRSLIVGDPTS